MKTEAQKVMQKVEKKLAKAGYSVDRGECELYATRDGSYESVRLVFKGGYFIGRCESE